MKHLKKFENFYLSPDVDSDEQDYLDYAKKMREVRPEEEITNPPHPHEEEEEFGMEMEPMSHEEEEESEMRPMAHEEEEESEMRPMAHEEEEEEEERKHIMSFEAKNNSYKKGKKKSKPDFLDLDKDGDKKESMKKAAKDAKKGGLTAAQKKLPEGLRKAIEKRKK